MTDGIADAFQQHPADAHTALEQTHLIGACFGDAHMERVICCLLYTSVQNAAADAGRLLQLLHRDILFTVDGGTFQRFGGGTAQTLQCSPIVTFSHSRPMGKKGS